MIPFLPIFRFFFRKAPSTTTKGGAPQPKEVDPQALAEDVRREDKTTIILG
jgi:hypothetical protein